MRIYDEEGNEIKDMNFNQSVILEIKSSDDKIEISKLKMFYLNGNKWEWIRDTDKR